MRFRFVPCRACERGEAVRAHVERYPYRWASRELGSACVSGALGVNLLCTGAWVFNGFTRFYMARARLLMLFEWVLRMLFKDLEVFAWVLWGTA